jgi:hypothetical protein
VPKVSAARVKCPDPAHADSRINSTGTYGKRGHRRQRYRCQPKGLSRTSSSSFCPERKPGTAPASNASRGRPARGTEDPRHYQFVARGIAEALQAVGAGDTYMQAIEDCPGPEPVGFRYDAETGEVRESDHGQLVADWGRVFAPVVFAPHQPTSWPPHGSLLLDHIPFRVRAEDASGRGIPGGTVAFDVFCAVG